MTAIRIEKDGQHSIDKKLFGNFIEHIENCILGGSLKDREASV